MKIFRNMKMSNLLPFLALTFFAISSLDAKAGNPELAILGLADGNTLKVEFHTALRDNVKYIEVSEYPDGKRVRYENDQIERITFLPPNENYIETVYVKADLYLKLSGKGLKESCWVREDYKGNGITLFSALNTAARPGLVGNASGMHSVTERKFYVAIGDGPAQWVSEDAPNIVNQKSANRLMLVRFFGKEYPDFAARIKNKEFDTKNTPLSVVKAWEETYGANR